MSVYWRIFFHVLLFIASNISAEIETSYENATNSVITTTTSSETDLSTTSTTSPTQGASPLPTLAAKLVRLRRQPVTIVRHIFHSSKRSKPRRRIKRPKVKYGPPNYSYGKPITYYKPQQSSPGPEHSSLSIDDLEHLNLNSADFDLPSNSYETQSMDLDLYSHGDSLYDAPKITNVEYTSFDIAPDAPSYSYDSNKSYERRKPSKRPSVEYSSFDAAPKGPSYSYIPSKAELSVPRKPHTKYGVPKPYDQSSGGYEIQTDVGHYDGSNILPTETIHTNDESIYSAPESHDAHSVSSYEAPTSFYNSKSHSYVESAPSNVPHIPSTEYGVPDAQIPLSYSSSKTEYHPPAANQDSYSTYSKKVPNSGYGSISGQHNFAEPPTHTDIEITYSPSFEISLPPSSNHKSAEQPYAPPSQGNFAEPPAHPANTAPVQSAHQPESPPSDNSHTPIYTTHPAPPPDDHPNIPVYSAHPGPSSSDYSNHPTYSAHPGHAEDYRPPPQELPLNPNHMQPAYDYPKSSYEVPIYDPIPFEASNTNEQEFYPPHSPDSFSTSDVKPKQDKGNSNIQYENKQTDTLEDSSVEEHSEDAHPSSSSTTTGQRIIRKRKRVRGTTTTTSTKHILDVPELEEAFQSHNRNKYRGATHTDADVNESNNVEKQNNYFLSTIPPNFGNDDYISQAWNPMRIRTPARIVTTPVTTLATEVRPVSSNLRPRHKNQYRGQQRRPASSTINEQASSTTKQITPNSEKVSIVSIEKSRSQSYYDGTVPPPTLTMSNLYQTRLNRFRMPTRLPHGGSTQVKDAGSSYRTTKSVFDTTYFKSPRNDKNVERKLSTLEHNLPKNHKLF